MPRPQPPLTTGLLADLEQKLQLKSNAEDISQRQMVENAGLDWGNVQKVLRKGRQQQGDVSLGTISEIAQRLDIVLEFQGFIVGPVIRPQP